MKAVVVAEPGGADQLAWREVPDVQVDAGEVLLDVAATAVNRADVLQRMGFYPPPPGASQIIGLECSGVVAELGEGVTEYEVGDEVCALLTGGGYAQRVTVPVGQVMPLPPGIDVVTAASIPEVACTVWSNLVDVAGLTSGDVLLIHGGSGGIGTFAIQFAKALGATVVVTAGTAEKLQACADLGADVGINYREQDFVEALRELGIRADVILDNMGAKYLERNIAVLAPDGDLVIIGMQGGVKAELNLASLIGVRGSIHTTSLRSRSTNEKARIASSVVRDIWPLFAEGKIRPIVQATMPITDVGLAHQTMEASTHVGKLVLTI